MKEQITKHIEELFAEAPRTRRAVDLKEEILQNTLEKYQDLRSEGYNEEDACQIVLNSIGDVTELFSELEEPNPLRLSAEERKKKAMLKAVSAGLYVLALGVYMVFLMADNMFYFGWPYLGMAGITAAALICIPATAILVYAAHMYPDFHKNKDTLVEGYKERAHIRNKERAVRISVNAIIWLLTVTFYFIVSFATFYWHVTWIIFLVGGCAQAVAALIFSLRREY